MIAFGIDIVAVGICVEELCKTRRQAVFLADLQELLHEGPLVDGLPLCLKHLYHFCVDVDLMLGCLSGGDVFLRLIVLIVVPCIDVLLLQHLFALPGVEGDDLVDEGADHRRSDLRVIDTDDDVADVRIIAVVEEGRIIDINAFHGVEVQHHLAVLHVVTEVTERDQGAVQLLSGIPYGLCILVNFRISLQAQADRGAVRDDLDDVDQVEHLGVREGVNAKATVVILGLDGLLAVIEDLAFILRLIGEKANGLHSSGIVVLYPRLFHLRMLCLQLVSSFQRHKLINGGRIAFSVNEAQPLELVGIERLSVRSCGASLSVKLQSVQEVLRHDAVQLSAVLHIADAAGKRHAFLSHNGTDLCKISGSKHMVRELTEHGVHDGGELSSLLADGREVNRTLRVIRIGLDGHLIRVCLIVQILRILRIQNDACDGGLCCQPVCRLFLCDAESLHKRRSHLLLLLVIQKVSDRIGIDRGRVCAVVHDDACIGELLFRLRLLIVFHAAQRKLIKGIYNALHVPDGAADILLEKRRLHPVVGRDAAEVCLQIRQELLELFNDLREQIPVVVVQLIHETGVRQDVCHRLRHDFTARLLIGNVRRFLALRFPLIHLVDALVPLVHSFVDDVIQRDLCLAVGILQRKLLVHGVEDHSAELVVLNRIPLLKEVQELMGEGAQHRVLLKRAHIVDGGEPCVDVNVDLILSP